MYSTDMGKLSEIFDLDAEGLGEYADAELVIPDLIMISMRLSESVRKSITHYAKTAGMSKSAWVAKALATFLEVRQPAVVACNARILMANRRLITFRVDRGLAAKVTAAAKHAGVSRTVWIIDAILTLIALS